MWLSVDPLAGKHPDISPYVYCADNPILYIDPDGRDWYLNKFTGNVTWKERTGDKLGYVNLGYTWGHTDVNGDRFLMDGGTKQISYNGKVLSDFNKKPDGSYGGFAFADGGNNQDPSSLRNGGRDAEWVDFKGLLELIDLLLGREPGKMGKINPSGKGTNGGGATQMDKVNDAVDAVGAGTGAAKEVDEAVNKKANVEVEKPKQSKQSEYIYTTYDPNNSNNNVQVRKDVYEAQQKKKNDN